MLVCFGILAYSWQNNLAKYYLLNSYENIGLQEYTKRDCHSRQSLSLRYTDKQLKNVIGIRLSRFFRRRFRPFLCLVTVVNDKHYRRDRPGDRIAEDDGVETRSEWYDEEEPGDTQQADTETGDKHRDHNISGSAECTGEQFDEDEQAVCRSNVV